MTVNCEECGKLISEEHDVVAYSIGHMCTDCLMANSDDGSEDFSEDSSKEAEYIEFERTPFNYMKGPDGCCIHCGKPLSYAICEECFFTIPIGRNDYIPTISVCPECGSQFVDDFEEKDSIDYWHRCRSCQHRIALSLDSSDSSYEASYFLGRFYD